MRLPSLLGALLHPAPHPATPTQHQEPTMAASAPAPAPEVEEMMDRVALECGGDISASQEEILAASSFLGGDNDFPASQDAEEEVFATPPDATQQQEDPITMCTLPFTPTPSKSPAPPSSQPQTHTPLSSDDGDDAPPTNPRRKARVGIRKVRGARISTPTPSPEQQQPVQTQPQPEQQQTQTEQPIHADPLVRAMLMIPSRTTAATGTTSSGNQDPVEYFIALARQKGIFKSRP